MPMSSFTVKSLVEKIDKIYNGKCDDEGDVWRTMEARSVLDAVINILRKNPDLTNAIDAAHPVVTYPIAQD